MERSTSVYGKFPVDKLRATISLVQENRLAAWLAFWAPSEPSFPFDEGLTSMRVGKGVEHWTYEDLNEFLSEYASPDVDEAQIRIGLADPLHRVFTLTYLLGDTTISMEAPAKGEILGVCLLFDQWSQEQRELSASREKAWAEQEALEIAESERVAREAEAKATRQAGRRWWHEISWADVRTNIVAWIIVVLVLIVVAVLAVQQGVG